MAAVVATTWTFHGSPAHVAPFQFLAAWSAKDAYIGGEGYAMTSAHVLRQAGGGAPTPTSDNASLGRTNQSHLALTMEG